MADQRDHDLRQRGDPLPHHTGGRRQDGPRLHPDDVRDQESQPAAAHAKHRVLLAHRLDRVQQLGLLGELLLEGRSIVRDRWRRRGLAFPTQELHRALGVLATQHALQPLGEGRRHAIADCIERGTATIGPV